MIYQTMLVPSKPLFVLVWCKTHKKAFGCFGFREFVADFECVIVRYHGFFFFVALIGIEFGVKLIRKC